MESALEMGQSAVKIPAKAVVGQIQTFGKIAGSQVLGTQVQTQPHATHPTTDADSQEFVKQMYAPTEKPKPAHMPQPAQNMAEVIMQQIKPADPVAEAKIAQTRQQLQALSPRTHKAVYYDPTFNRPQQRPEETVADQNAQEEEQKKRWQLDEKKKKDNAVLERMQRPQEIKMGNAG